MWKVLETTTNCARTDAPWQTSQCAVRLREKSADTQKDLQDNQKATGTTVCELYRNHFQYNTLLLLKTEAQERTSKSI